jgi:hypothetical protein
VESAKEVGEFLSYPVRPHDEEVGTMLDDVEDDNVIIELEEEDVADNTKLEEDVEEEADLVRVELEVDAPLMAHALS